MDMRKTIIDVLLATRSLPEGVAADAILAALASSDSGRGQEETTKGNAAALFEFANSVVHGAYVSAGFDSRHVPGIRAAAQYLDTLSAAPTHPEQPAIVADKQECSPHEQLAFVGYTNGSQILYANDPNFGGEGQFYIDTDHNSVIPLYMLKTHWHRLESTTDGEVTLDRIRCLQRPEAPEKSE